MGPSKYTCPIITEQAQLLKYKLHGALGRAMWTACIHSYNATENQICYSLFTPTVLSCPCRRCEHNWSLFGDKTRQFCLVSTYSNFQVFSSPQYVGDWTVANWKLGRDKTRVSCIVLSPILFTLPTRTKQDKTVSFCPCRRCEQAIMSKTQQVQLSCSLRCSVAVINFIHNNIQDINIAYSCRTSFKHPVFYSVQHPHLAVSPPWR